MTSAITSSVGDQRLALAYVVDAHNIGCLVRFSGAPATHQAGYSAAIQSNGVVIRSCHMVVVEQHDNALEVVWRIGTIGAIEAIGDGKLTVNLGYRVVTIPYRDERPDVEQTPALAVGDRVLLRGAPIEQSAISDTLRDGELAHPERLWARVERALNEHHEH